MVLGLNVTVETLVPGGIALFVLLLIQILLGKRVIRFKGRLHSRVHAWTAYVMAALALVHGALGVVLALHLRIG